MNEPFPNAFEEQMRENLAEQWQAFHDAHSFPAPVSIRINPKKTSNTSYSKRIPWTTHGYYLDKRPSFTLDPSFHAGSYYVQEASSMFLEQVVLQCVDLKKKIKCTGSIGSARREINAPAQFVE